MDRQYSVQFFTSFVESVQKLCRDFLDFDQAVELSGYLSLEIDNSKKERYVLSELVQNSGDVISESYCTKAFRTVRRIGTLKGSGADDTENVASKENRTDKQGSVERTFAKSKGKEITIDLRDDPFENIPLYRASPSQTGNFFSRQPSATSSSPATRSLPSGRPSVNSVPQNFSPSSSSTGSLGLSHSPSFATGQPVEVSSRGQQQQTVRPRQQSDIGVMSSTQSSDLGFSNRLSWQPLISSVQSLNPVGPVASSSSSCSSGTGPQDSRATKRRSSNTDSLSSNKREKTGSHIESLLKVTQDICSTNPLDTPTQGISARSREFSVTSASPQGGSGGPRVITETIRLPVKEEADDVPFMVITPALEDDEQTGRTDIVDDKNSFDDSCAYFMDTSGNQSGQEPIAGPSAISEEENANTARKTRAHVKLFQKDDDNSDRELGYHPSDQESSPRHISETWISDEPKRLVQDNDVFLSVDEIFQNTSESGNQGDLASSDSLYQHAENPKIYRCDVCSKVFTHKFGLTHHLRREHKLGKCYQCWVCCRSFAERLQLKRHQKTHESLFHRCNICGRKFQYERSLRQHQEQCGQNVHILGHSQEEERRSLKCGVCGKTFTKYQYLKQHSALHAEPSYICNVCGKAFRWDTSFRRHTISHL